MSTLVGLPHRPVLGDLPAEDQIDLLGHDRLVDAVAAAVWRLHGLRGFTASMAGKRREGSAVMVVPLDDDAYAFWRGGSSDQQDWACRSATEPRGVPNVLRFSLLRRALLAVEPVDAAITHELRTLTPEPPINQAVLTALYAAWWAARLSEGHTPESARVMLSLIVTSKTLPWLQFGEQGPPEVNEWCDEFCQILPMP